MGDKMKYLYIGKIVNTHGIKGEVRILSKFKYKDKVFKKDMVVYIGKNKDKEVINSYRVHKMFDMICMDGYNNINQILKYKGENLYINRDDLVLLDGEYLDEDLIGLDVRVNNQKIGNVKKIDKSGKQGLIVIKVNEKDCLIPYVSDIIEEINFKEGYLSIKDIKGLI